MSKSKKKKKKKKDVLIKPRGMGLSVKLFRIEGLAQSASQLASLFKKTPYAPKKKKDITSGFVKAKAVDNSVQADFIAGFRVPVIGYDKDGQLATVHYISVDRGTVIVKTTKSTVEVRGSGRVASRFRRVLEEHTGAKMSPLNLNGGTKKVYDTAADIASIRLTMPSEEDTRGRVQTTPLSNIEFQGEGIQSADEIVLYTRKYKGEIVRFRGTFPYPSGAFLTTSVNALVGSIMVYKTGDGILESDLNWIVNLLEDAALGQ